MGLRIRLFTLLTVFVALALVTSSGAFSTVTAERTVSVDVASDDAALLELRPHNGANGAYASQNAGGELEINFDGVSASGVNPNAVTKLDYVFNVTNQGTQSVDLWIEKTGSNTGAVTFYSGTTAGTVISNGASNAVPLNVGATVQVSIEIDTTDGSTGSLLDSITIHAEAP